MPRCLALAAAAALAAGCAPATLYHWRGYDEALYRHHRNPQDREAWVASLEAVIRESEERGLRVPPGVCAEYGHELYEEGRVAEAIAWFERERAEWPESGVLMEKLIRNATVATRAHPVPAALAPAGPPERLP